MFIQDFWTAPVCHLALSPHCPHDADGLLEFARRQGWSSRCFFQTSGSEGMPKWVSLTKEAFLISARAVNAHFRVSAADRWLIALPLHHVGGFSIIARAHLSGSSYVQYSGKWHPQQFVALCRNEEVTLVSLVPTQVHDLVIQQLSCPEKLRAVIIGGGAISTCLVKSAQALGWPVFQSYGMTEAASQIATQSLELPGEDGLEILPHWQLSTDPTGHLLLSGPALANGYLKRSSEGEWSWSEIGDTLKTRDLVRLSQQGSRRLLHFVGRESGVIKIFGELIYLGPLQEKLDQILLEQGSSSCPVILALPDARREMKLVLIYDSGDPEPWLSVYNRSVNSLCQITETRRVPVIPRTELGKVDSLALQGELSR
jgi:O-succinylbenzoic acid--CoA ligase